MNPAWAAPLQTQIGNHTCFKCVLHMSGTVMARRRSCKRGVDTTGLVHHGPQACERS